MGWTGSSLYQEMVYHLYEASRQNELNSNQILKVSFKETPLKMSSAKWQPCCSGLIVLTLSGTHYSDVIMPAMASEITSLMIVYSTVYSGADKKKTSKLRVTGLCAGNLSVTGEFPAQRASTAENVSTWWRHHMCCNYVICLIDAAILFLPFLWINLSISVCVCVFCFVCFLSWFEQINLPCIMSFTTGCRYTQHEGII